MTEMIDINDKETVKRSAIASGSIGLSGSTIGAIRDGRTKKGDVLTVAQVAAINAVKDTPRIIPLCHQVPVDHIHLDYGLEKDHIKCTCKVVANYRTGVEMEALVGVTVALLTIWDMVKYLEKENGQYPHTSIQDVVVEKKVKEG